MNKSDTQLNNIIKINLISDQEIKTISIDKIKLLSIKQIQLLSSEQIKILEDRFDITNIYYLIHIYR